jgi:hypothetical protein
MRRLYPTYIPDFFQFENAMGLLAGDSRHLLAFVKDLNVDMLKDPSLDGIRSSMFDDGSQRNLLIALRNHFTSQRGGFPDPLAVLGGAVRWIDPRVSIEVGFPSLLASLLA